MTKKTIKKVKVEETPIEPIKVERTEEQIKVAEEAGKKDAQEKIDELNTIIEIMNKYGFSIEPKIYMRLEEAKKKLV